MTQSLLRHLLILAFLTLSMISSACISPIMSTVDISSADKALKDARGVNAMEKAPYEYFMAQEMLRKAEEEWGYAEYSKSSHFAEEAIKFANRSFKKAQSDPWLPPPDDLDAGVMPPAKTNDSGPSAAPSSP